MHRDGKVISKPGGVRSNHDRAAFDLFRVNRTVENVYDAELENAGRVDRVVDDKAAVRRSGTACERRAGGLHVSVADRVSVGIAPDVAVIVGPDVRRHKPGMLAEQVDWEGLRSYGGV